MFPKGFIYMEKEKEKKTKKKKKEEIKPLKPVFSIANIVYTSVIFGAVAIALVLLPRPTVSNIEQRELAKFPVFTYEKFMNGEYTAEITEFYNDTVPYRDSLKNVAAGIKGLYGVSFNDSELHGQLSVVTSHEEEEEPEIVITTKPVTSPVTEDSHASDSTTAATEETTVTTTEPPVTEKNVNEIAEGVITNGQVVTKLSDGHYWAISCFGGGSGKTYAAALNAFREQLDDNVKIYSMVVPTAGEYYLPDKYDDYNASHQKSIDSINEQLNEGITPVDAIGELWNHIDEPIYTRTDHHWQPLGAYYAAKTFAEAAGVPFADISTMEQVDIEGYVGTMYSFTESANILSDPETFTYYKPTNSYKTFYYDRAYNFDYEFPFFVKMPVSGSYSTFMAGDDKIVRIETDVDNGRKLLVFKDSYGNAEIPFYFGSFEEIYVCDMRYFSPNAIEFIKEHEITDLLFTMCTFSAVGTNAKGLVNVLNN